MCVSVDLLIPLGWSVQSTATFKNARAPCDYIYGLSVGLLYMLACI